MAVDRMIEQGVAHLARTVLNVDGTSRIFDLEKIFVGMEADIYSFSVESGAGEGHKVSHYVIKEFSEGNVEKAQTEFDAMKAVIQVGLTCPRPIAVDTASTFFSRPFVLMEKVQGMSLKQAYYDAGTEEEKNKCLSLFCRIFGDIHWSDWSPAREHLLTWEDADVYGYLLTLMPVILEEIKRSGKPGFAPVWNWLGERIKDVPCERPSLIHGDFHPGNVLLPHGSPPVVIDWGGATIGDVRKDLAWTMLLVGAYETSLRDLILDEYRRQWGELLEGYEYFEVLTCLQRLLFLIESYDLLARRLEQRENSEWELSKLTEQIESIHQMVKDRTGIEIPEVDAVVATLPGAAYASV